MSTATCPECGEELDVDRLQGEGLESCPWCGAQLPPIDEIREEAARRAGRPREPSYAGLEALHVILLILALVSVLIGAPLAMLMHSVGGVLAALGAAFQFLILALLIEALRDIAINLSVLRQIAEIELGA